MKQFLVQTLNFFSTFFEHFFFYFSVTVLLEYLDHACFTCLVFASKIAEME